MIVVLQGSISVLPRPMGIRFSLHGGGNYRDYLQLTDTMPTCTMVEFFQHLCSSFTFLKCIRLTKALQNDYVQE